MIPSVHPLSSYGELHSWERQFPPFNLKQPVLCFLTSLHGPFTLGSVKYLGAVALLFAFNFYVFFFQF